MQRYLLRNFEITAIMDSAVERFFPSASVNTTIVIVRKQRDEDVRKANITKFIYFNSTLTETIQKYKSVNKLHDLLKSANESEENEYFRLNCIHQETLSKFTKWGQFLKAPKVYFNILEKGKDIFVSLSDLAIVKFGLKTGCNDFFILKDITNKAEDKQLRVAVNNFDKFETVNQFLEKDLRLVQNGFNEIWLIEQRFLFPMLTSPKDLKTYESTASELPYSIFIIDQDKRILKTDYPYSFSYIFNAEKKNINRASSLASRNKWYYVGAKVIPSLSFNYIINDVGKTFSINAFSNNNFHNIYPKDKSKTIGLYMNSTLSWLTQQLIMRVNLGDGAGKIETYDLAALSIPNIDLEYLDINLGETKSFKDELGTLENLKTINTERIRLDNAILEAIGYNNKQERDEILLELYKETYKLINARLKKAQSLKGVKGQRNKIKFEVYIDQLKEMLVEGKYEAKNTFKFAKKLEKLVLEISSESKLQKKILDTYWKERFGELFNEEKIAGDEQIKLF